MDNWLKNNPITLVLISILFAVGLFVYLDSQPKNHEECLVKTAKNMPAKAMGFVRVYCDKHFPPTLFGVPADEPLYEILPPKNSRIPEGFVLD